VARHRRALAAASRCRLARLLLASLARSWLLPRPRACSMVHLFAFLQVMLCLTLG
jgi:hypothetical protein